ncbi:hypothetical protein EDD86DRAFT_213179 [Gorgonomyces haynaldii]|nr:hypothetical protein EDD86DRAFT_213179 [Gorgonomyces haynaldii]
MVYVFREMQSLSGNTILITGGGSGIGLAIAKRFKALGNTVIITGRRLQVLEEQKKQGFEVIQGDVATEEGRIKLWETVVAKWPSVNVLVNNAGIQRDVDVKVGVQPDWKMIQSEIDTNASGPVHLALLAIPHLEKQKNPAIFNVTSGLSFFPYVKVPVYSATKAFLHSFTWSLRYQLQSTNIKVIEIIPPAVNTDLNAPGKHTFGADVDIYADDIFEKLKKGEEEIGYQLGDTMRLKYREQFEGIFKDLNARMH